eukprot:CAMPEP_0170261840 /NCGR_PEP_ID=MMETSP0116_2-20130129/30802_1 /TAXON_ID=400756 /ORGANISM="Durinskia baltica, Strain CSIRO CS-38" /LENGTH=268 /DNA_ID=CAMNT_0010512907 /DNA_START=65 /DNA_END=868 /DNA_ORIENTATION=-
MSSTGSVLRLASSSLLLMGAADANVLWGVKSGPCKQVGACIMSPNYPNKYGNDEQCEIVTRDKFPGFWVAEFETEPEFDQLLVRYRDFSGTFTPKYETKPGGGTITFKANEATTRMGWKLCPKDVNGPMWTVTGPCPIWKDNCITSTNFPRDYPNGMSCTITYPPGFGGVNIVYMATDPMDQLTFDDTVVLRGGIRPWFEMSVPGKIIWKSDNNDDGAEVRRWKLCQKSPPKDAESDKEYQEALDRASDINPNGRASPLGQIDFDQAA